MEIFLLVIVTLIIVFFIYRPIKAKSMNNNETNIVINQQKLKELKNELDQGLITQENFVQTELEIQKNLASELDNNNQNHHYNKHFVAIFVVTFTVSMSYIIYDAVQSKQVVTVVPPVSTIEVLKDHLDNNPSDENAWQMLGAAYSIDKRITKAKGAYEKAYELGNKNINFLTEYAGVLAILNDNDFSGKPSDLVREALTLDKNSINALYLAGIIAANSNAFDLAKQLWQKALSLSTQDSEEYQLLAGVLQQLADFTNQSSSGPSVATVEINVVVDIDEVLYKKRFNDYIMIYAKNTTGRPMPIAIEKIPLRDFNGSVVLSDANSVMPTNKLSATKEIIIVARISKTGEAFKQPGDIEVKSNVLKVNNQTVELKIE